MERLKILFIEPFYGGSHKDFADGLIKHSRHEITFFSLPARYWKWRMRGAALHFCNAVKDPADFDLLITTDMMSLSDLKMLWGTACPPAVVYFHENQLSYPLAEGEKMDYQFGFTDITSSLAADRLLFNSYYHMDRFIADMPGFISKMPEFKPFWVVDKIRGKSSVIYPGCTFAGSADNSENNSVPRLKTPAILWNHRWEFDKCPDEFFRALDTADHLLKSEGIEQPFNLVILGENYKHRPPAFGKAKNAYKDRILQYGFCESKTEYYSWLKKSDIVISTAIQENFGISIVEAVQAGNIPLLPDRLSYPEIIPSDYHKDVLYADYDDLLKKLIRLLKMLHSDDKMIQSRNPGAFFSRFSWEESIVQYDDFFNNILI